MENKRNKGQVSVWVIVAIAFIAGIILLFALNPGIISQDIDPELNPEGFVRDCLDDIAEESMSKVIENGGYIDIKDAEKTMKYDFRDIAYLCYVEEEVQNCRVLEPALVRHVELELKEDLFDDLEGCFGLLEESLERFGYSGGFTGFEVDVQPERVVFEIDKEVNFDFEGEAKSFDDFTFSIDSNMFEVLSVSNELINSEARADCNTGNGNADIIGIQREHREVELERFITGANEKVYTVRDFESEGEFVFAIRNCVRDP